MNRTQFFNNVLKGKDIHETEKYFQEYLTSAMDKYPNVQAKLAEIERYRSISNAHQNLYDKIKKDDSVQN